MKSINFRGRFAAGAAVLIAAGMVIYVLFSQPTRRPDPVAVRVDVPEEVLPLSAPNKTEVATQDIYPKLTNPEKRFFPGYPDFEEAPGALPGEVVLFAPCGAKVKSIYEGIVLEVEASGRWNGGYGNFVRLEIPGGNRVYTHLDKIFIKEGEVVRKGGAIGTAGRTGSLPEEQPCLFGLMD